MILPTNFEYKIFLITFLFGMIAGNAYGLTRSVLVIFKNNNIAKNILDFISVAILFVIFFININYYNYGEFRLFLLVAFALGVILERNTLGKLFAKTFDIGYNFCIKCLARFKNSKLGNKIFK